MRRVETYRLVIEYYDGRPLVFMIETKDGERQSQLVDCGFAAALQNSVRELRQRERDRAEPQTPPLSERTREEHIIWCKWRALQYLEDGEIQNAVTSMLSDMGKHPECGTSTAVSGLSLFSTNTYEDAKRFIDGFN